MKAKRKARGAWRDPSALDLVKRDALDNLQTCTEIFEAKWGFEKLRALDEDLYEALADQRDMLVEACAPAGQLTNCLEHRDAMRRGWKVANLRMEESLIRAVVVAFPGARVTSVRYKEDNPLEPPLPLELPDVGPEPGDEPPDAA